MRRVVSLFLPTWSIDRLRRQTAKQPDQLGSARAPLVTAIPDHGRRLIASVDARARALGLLPGMTVTKGRSLAPELDVVDAQPQADLEGLHRLALWAGRRYSPQVAPDPPDGLWLDITGCASLFGSERALLKDLHRRVFGAGLAVQIAVADTAGCAHAVARYVPAGRPVTIEPGDQRKAILLLPIASLRLDAGIVEGLRKLGFERVEQLIGVPRGPIAKRFGRDVYRRLDQALGFAPEAIEPVFPARVSRVRRGLLEPVSTADAFVKIIHDLVGDLTEQLIADGKGARRLDCYFHRVDGHIQAIRVGTAAPSRDTRHLAKLLATKVETIDPGLGIEIITLVAPLVEPLGGRQSESIETGGKHESDLAALVDALANRFGPRRLYRTHPETSIMPERSIGVTPALAKAAGQDWDDDLPRPSRMLSPPERVDVTAMLPDHPPAMFIWRRKRYRVLRADGPERLQGEWWRESGHEAANHQAIRDYFQVEVEGGGRYWLFRLGDGERPASGPMRWFIHGAFA
jgi:protein ImuB